MMTENYKLLVSKSIECHLKETISNRQQVQIWIKKKIKSLGE